MINNTSHTNTSFSLKLYKEDHKLLAYDYNMPTTRNEILNAFNMNSIELIVNVLKYELIILLCTVINYSTYN